jgi:hypothetical protein
MVKKLAVILILVWLLFLAENMQYFPGSAGWYDVARNATRVSIILFIALMCLWPFCMLYIILTVLKTGKLKELSAFSVVVAITPAVYFLVARTAGVAVMNVSKDRSILNAQPLIDSIEQYSKHHGHYPDSLDTRIYPTGTIGIKQYYYQPDSNGYRIRFEYRPYLMIKHSFTYAPVDSTSWSKWQQTRFKNWYESFED